MTEHEKIVARLREMADGLSNGVEELWDRDDVRAQVGWAQDLTAAADALQAEQSQREAAERERDEARALHQELMFQVGKKCPGETRHETARRYIREHEHCGEGGPARTTEPHP